MMKASVQVLLLLLIVHFLSSKGMAHRLVNHNSNSPLIGNAILSSTKDLLLQLSGGGSRRRKWRRVPTQIVVATFNDCDKAEEAADLLRDAADAGILHFRNMAVVQKERSSNDGGGVKIHEVGYHTVPYAATVGMFVGGLSLLLLGPAGVIAGGAAGAIVGGAGQALLEEAEAAQAAFSDGSKKMKRRRRREQDNNNSLLTNKNRLVALGDILRPGTSAIVVVFEEVNVDRRTTQNVRIQKTIDVVLASLAMKLKRALRRKKDVAFAISVNEKGIRSVRMVSDDDAIDIQGMFVTSTSEGVRLGRASVSPHHEGIAYEVAETTNDGHTSIQSGTTVDSTNEL